MNAVCGVKIVNIGEGRFCSLPMHFFFFFCLEKNYLPNKNLWIRFILARCRQNLAGLLKKVKKDGFNIRNFRFML